MKKTLLFLSTITFLLAACGGSTSNSETAATTAPATSESKPAMEPGELLIVKSDCIGCHHKEDKLIGPAYQEIAAKYPSTDENVNLLADKIVKGGKGVWGNIPMTPHTKITNDEAKLMVKYILTLKK
ncbi:MAG: c-type cytochrome [Pedobacter sp.]|jgi:cytochrome c|uniref:c-type cytochrome n=1 Tax=Pedobacter sp. TaxID=1411316 RepID=UPI0035698E99